MPQISSVLVPCLVLQLNNTILGWHGSNTITGQVLNVPCRNDFIDDTCNYWFVPVKDEGVLTTFSIVPAVDAYASAPPTFDSLQMFRVRDKLSRQTWWIYGTYQNFISACASCCDSPPIPMPGQANGESTLTRIIAPCQTICNTNEDFLGIFYTVWGLPTLPAGQTYFPIGAYQDSPLQAASAAGYATIQDLLDFLNSFWDTFNWTASADGLTLIAAGGDQGNTLCVTVIAITP